MADEISATISQRGNARTKPRECDTIRQTASHPEWSCSIEAASRWPAGHLPNRCHGFSEPFSNVKKVPGEDSCRHTFHFLGTAIKNFDGRKKKVSLSLLKGHPSKQSSAFPGTFSEPSDLRFRLNRFGQTVICPSKSRLISHPRKRQDFHVTYAVSWIINGYLTQDENSWHRWTLRT